MINFQMIKWFKDKNKRLLGKHIDYLIKEEQKEVEARWFFPLKKEDIEEKIQVNLEKKEMTLEKLRDLLQQEKYQRDRITLKKEYDFLKWNFIHRLFFRKKVFHSIMRLKLQAQNLKEQIDYIEKKILTENVSKNK